MKSIISIIIISLFLVRCTKKEKESSKSEVDSTSKAPVSDFIEIPFSKLKRLAELDSVEFLNEMKVLGYSTTNNFLFATQRILATHKDSVGIIGIGRFFFHEIPVFIKPVLNRKDTYFRKCIYYSFPIKFLSTYKYSMLENQSQFFKIGQQEARYDDVYKKSYIQEQYIDIISKFEYEYLIGDNYVTLILRERTYL